ncbi:ABC transporter permease [Acuticoccus mangrovi]|uniref:ABC transporter permease n=1 Tax=Acuticoccus mangrovi TaxID=2796142 RepID=A0A934IRW3_9HYPH|nr:ABC transporter permease [Acuticoccus mangrovi]MBJ3777503.1 ABC transporter permease [Acuticoccus mangrovi]
MSTLFNKTFALRRRQKRNRYRSGVQGIVGLALMGMVIIPVIFAPLIAPYSPTALNLSNVLAGPMTGGHILGTDQLGRDLLSRVLYGGRVPLIVVTAAVLLASIVGVVLGMTAGYLGGWIDQAVSRFADIQLSIPSLLLALVMLAFAGSSLTTLILVIALGSWPAQFRIVRAQSISLRKMPFVEAAVVGCVPAHAILRRHFLPNVMPMVVVTATLSLSAGLLIVASLGFLGLGIRPDTPDWGAMIAIGQTQLGRSWLLAVAPGVALLLLLLGVQLVGDWLADRFSVQGLLARGG